MEESEHHQQNSTTPQGVNNEFGRNRSWSRMSDSTSYSTATVVEPSPINLQRTYSSRKFHVPSGNSFVEKEGPEPRSKLNSSHPSHHALASLFDISRPAYFPHHSKRQRSGNNFPLIDEGSVETESSFRSHPPHASSGNSDAIASPIERVVNDIQRHASRHASPPEPPESSHSSPVMEQMEEGELRSAIDKRIRWYQTHKRQRRSSLPDGQSLGRNDHQGSNPRRRRHSIPSPVGNAQSNRISSKESRFEMHTVSSQSKYRPERRVLPKHPSSENIRQLELQLASPDYSQPSDWLKSPPYGTINTTNRKIAKGGGYSPTTAWSSPDKHTSGNYWNRMAKSVGLGRQTAEGGSYRRLPTRREDIHIRSRLKEDLPMDELNEYRRRRFMQPTYSWSKQVKDAADVKERYKWTGRSAISPESRNALYGCRTFSEKRGRGMSLKKYNHMESSSTRAVDESHSGGGSDRQSITIASNKSIIDEDSISERTPNYPWWDVTDADNGEETGDTDQDTTTLDQTADNRTEIDKLLGNFRNMLQSADQHTSRLASSFYGR